MTISKDNEQTKKNYTIFRKFFKNYIYSSLYVYKDCTPEDIVRNKIISSKISSSIYDNRILFSKEDTNIDKTHLVKWIKEICDELNLTYTTHRDIGKYNKENCFLFLDVSNYVLMFDRYVDFKDKTKFGMIYLNNPDLMSWDDEKLLKMENIIKNFSEIHNIDGGILVSSVDKYKDYKFIESLNFRKIALESKKENKELEENKKLSFLDKFKQLFKKQEENFIFEDKNKKPNVENLINKMTLIIKSNNQIDKDIINKLNFIKEKIIENQNVFDNSQVDVLTNLINKDIPEVLKEYTQMKNKFIAKDIVINILHNVDTFLINNSTNNEEELKKLKVIQKYTRSLA